MPSIRKTLIVRQGRTPSAEVEACTHQTLGALLPISFEPMNFPPATTCTNKFRLKRSTSGAWISRVNPARFEPPSNRSRQIAPSAAPSTGTAVVAHAFRKSVLGIEKNEGPPQMDADKRKYLFFLSHSRPSAFICGSARPDREWTRINANTCGSRPIRVHLRSFPVPLVLTANGRG